LQLGLVEVAREEHGPVERTEIADRKVLDVAYLGSWLLGTSHESFQNHVRVFEDVDTA